jgi:hypothetical protein
MSLQTSISNSDRNRLTSFNPVRSFLSLASANAAGAGSSVTLNSNKPSIGVQVITSGTVSALTIVVEQAIGFSGTDASSPPALVYDSTPLYTWALGTNTSGQVISINSPGTVIRMRITNFTGTGSVDGWLAV